ncbi:hypothetical protein TIFTF001_054205 [Ficus carica]|uniref:Uncharacterized protein n=1 Tax=Ficus carica TaxID=3494 RepID=A0AA88EE98_FICCA|nr:hypothetical protein TIFTF001_054205 [Ficus carica]
MLWKRKGQLEKIVDPLLAGEINPNSLRVVGEIVEKCLSENGSDRPTMQEVEWNLNYALELQRNETTKGLFEDTATIDASLETALGISSYALPVGEDIDTTLEVSGFSSTISR